MNDLDRANVLVSIALGHTEHCAARLIIGDGPTHDVLRPFFSLNFGTHVVTKPFRAGCECGQSQLFVRHGISGRLKYPHE